MLDEKAFCRVISENQSFIITTHKFCDGDGLGAGCALGYGLQKAGKKVSFITLDTPHEKYRFLDGKGFITPFQSIADLELKLKEADCILAIDLSDPVLMEPLYSLVEKSGCRICFIDHHPLHKKLTTPDYFINTAASSTGELVYHLLQALKIPLDEQIAKSLYTSIVFDTKCFRFIKNSSAPFSISAELIPYISNVDQIYESLFKNLSAENLNFFSYLNNTEYHNNNQYALLHLTEADLVTHKADLGIACDLLDMIMNVSTMQIAVLILERKENCFKMSIRSRKKNILPFARSLGGGGHTLSAGAYIQNMSYTQIREKFISEFVA
ncbi:MAG: DHH family phosphoesterase [Bdellovibrionales bacterium]|nr:DHH family phosphoesterase [Bdellovibrionales bacterium]